MSGTYEGFRCDECMKLLLKPAKKDCADCEKGRQQLKDAFTEVIPSLPEDYGFVYVSDEEVFKVEGAGKNEEFVEEPLTDKPAGVYCQLDKYRFIPDGVQVRHDFIGLDSEGNVVKNEEPPTPEEQEISRMVRPKPRTQYLTVNGKPMSEYEILMSVEEAKTDDDSSPAEGEAEAEANAAAGEKEPGDGFVIVENK